MKRAKIYLLLLAGMLLLAGCQRGNLNERVKKDVRFTAQSVSVGTKTDYGQYSTDKTWQSIDWENGDRIRITSPEATHRYDNTRHYAEYMVIGAAAGTSPGKTGNPSKARLTNAGIPDPEHDPGVPDPAGSIDQNVNGLVWGDADSYHFFGIYPSPAVNSDIEFPFGGTGYNVADLVLPNVQTYTQESATDMVLDPDMNYAFLGASAQVASRADVELVFKPYFTAFEFTLDCESDAVVLKKFELTSDSKAMAGHYKASMTTASDSWESTVSITPATTNAGGVSIVFDRGGLQVTKGNPVTFTLFAIPVDYNDLKVTVSVSEVGGTAVKQNSIALKKIDSAITFGAFKKHVITGLVNPAFTKLIEINSLIVDWVDQGSTSIEVTP